MPTGKKTGKTRNVADAGGAVFARLDLDRSRRCGAPEAVFALMKTPDETLAIAEELVARQGHALVTRADTETMARLAARWPGLRASPRAGAAVVGRLPRKRPGRDWVAITAAGTSDLPVAKETALTLEALGIRHRLVADVGVAGIHRLLEQVDALRRAAVVVAVAGMEGALPSVVAGLVSAPVIAVPTSVGYGVSTGGFAALLGMLGSCAPGITVVNIDNGFGAAMAAARILGRPGRAGKAQTA